jgi:hypothetical protein
MRKPKVKPFTSLAGFHCGTDAAGNMAVFLLEQTGSIFGKWSGRLTASDQRKLFGRFIGKGTIEINGAEEEVGHIKSVCFGTMREMVAAYPWRKLSAEMLNEAA